MGPEQAIYRGAQCELKSRLGICGRKALIATIRSLSPVTTAMLDTKTAAEFFPDSSRTVRQHRSGPGRGAPLGGGGFRGALGEWQNQIRWCVLRRTEKPVRLRPRGGSVVTRNCWHAEPRAPCHRRKQSLTQGGFGPSESTTAFLIQDRIQF